MLRLEAVTVRFGTTVAVDDVSITVPDGAVLALLGPSGCGKSTLLRAVAGLEPLGGGAVTWDGVDLARIPVHRRGFGLMFQDGVLFPHRTVGGNVAYGLRGRPGAEERVAQLLALVGLAGYEDRAVATLSGGEAQRVALARALAPGPRLLLLDEPLAALDRALREHLLADLRRIITATGTTAIFVTHDQGEAFAVADRLALMCDGRIVQTGPPREVWSQPGSDWAARFLGCTSVIAARPERHAAGGWRSVTRFGPVPGRAERVGLRPAALAAADRGAITGEVTSVVAGPERVRLTVRIGYDGVPGDTGSGADGRDGDPRDGGLGDGEFQAVADPSRPVSVGDRVRLRFDPDGAAPIG